MSAPKNVTRFSSLDSLPTNSDAVYLASGSSAVRCLHCTLDLGFTVVGCPVRCVEFTTDDSKHCERQHDGNYFTVGRFCSYNCAKAFAIEHAYNPLFSNSCRYINTIASLLAKTPVDVAPSPPKEFLRCYGGYMTTEQYQSEIGKVSYVYNGTTVSHPLTLVYSRKLHHM